MKWTREKCFEYFGYRGMPGKCNLCDSTDVRTQPQSLKKYCFDCFDKTNWWVHPLVEEWYKSWGKGVAVKKDKPSNNIEDHL